MEKREFSNPNLGSYVGAFCEETREFLEEVTQRLLELEQGKKSVLEVIFRCLHTIKGGAGVLELTPIVRLSHAMEEVVEQLRKEEISLSPEVVEELFEATEKLKKMVEDIEEGKDIREDKDTEKQLLALMERKTLVLSPSGTPEEGDGVTQELLAIEQELLVFLLDREKLDALRRRFCLLQEKMHEQGGSEAADYTLAFVRYLELVQEKEGEIDFGSEEFLEGLRTSIEKIKGLWQAFLHKKDDKAKGRETPPEPGEEKKSQYLRIEERKIDTLTNLVGELMTARGNYEYLLEKLMDSSVPSGLTKALQENYRSLSRICEELQKGLFSLQLVPVRFLFQRFPKVVRDIALQKKKKIRLVTAGENVEVDKKVLDALSGPVLHLVRNACDHGIEPPEERLAAGKSEEGIVSLKAWQRGSFVYLEVSDDGRGLDFEKILSKARALGLVPEGASPSEEEILNFIFSPGFSTADSVSEISGRGIGMDVVQTTVRELGGDVEVKTALRKGTWITLKVPTRLGVQTVLLVGVNGERYALPLEQVVSILKLSRNDVFLAGGFPVFSFRGKITPLYPFAHLLGERESSLPEEVSVVVVADGRRTLALSVDQILGCRSIVTKPLPAALQGGMFISSTILGDGRVVLVVDPFRAGGLR